MVLLTSKNQPTMDSTEPDQVGSQTGLEISNREKMDYPVPAKKARGIIFSQPFIVMLPKKNSMYNNDH